MVILLFHAADSGRNHEKGYYYAFCVIVATQMVCCRQAIGT